MNNSQPTSYLLPDLMIDMFVPTQKPASKLDSPEFETDMLLAQELLSDLLLIPNSPRKN